MPTRWLYAYVCVRIFLTSIDKYTSSHPAPPPLDSDELQPLRSGMHLSLTSQGFEVAKMFSSMLGLLVHAAADGIAMGASSRSIEASLRVVVALAIMVHKAPTSIGLCTLLMAQQIPSRMIRIGILLFSLTTPSSALITYVVLRVLIPVDSGEKGHDVNTTDKVGAVLTLSGGTFLFVAMHAVQRLSQPPPMRDHTPPQDNHHVHHPHDHDHPIHTDEDAPTRTAPPPERNEIGTWECVSLVTLGAVTPKVLQLLLGDTHAHH